MVGLVLSVATVGCVKTDDPSANQSGMVTLQLSNGTLTTRAVGTNDDTNNEDLIVDAQVFFFKSDANNATVQYSYYTNITDVKETATISIPLTTEQLTSLFPGGNGYVYVIANYGSEITGATTLAKLKETAIDSAFGTDVDGVQPSFIMDSDLTTVARGTANTITGEVFLTRAAAKVELTVNVAPITQDGKQWIADTANMRLSFNNGVSNGFIDDGSDDGATPASDGTTFDIAGRGFKTVTGEAGSGLFVQSVPFYSYSTKWTTSAENEVYLELAIPWAVKTEGDAEPTYQTFYYQVPVSADKMSLVRNAYYKLTLDVGVLGGLTKPVTVVPSYVVIDWGTNNVNVTLSRPKYLVVDEKEVILNNTTVARVGYQSSDAITAYIIGFKCSYFKKSSSGSGGGGWYPGGWYPGGGSGSSTNVTKINVNDVYEVADKTSSIADVADGLTGEDYRFNVSWDETTKQVIFSHLLDNTKGDNDTAYHYFPYEVTVRVTNTETGFYEDIVFKQYPAMYFTSVKSEGTNYVFVNKNQSTNNDENEWWHKNNGVGPNMTDDLFTITVSAFDLNSSNYIICDPREPSNTSSTFEFYRINTNGTNQTGANAKVTTAQDAANDSTLTGYRATIEQNSDNLVAPSFIIASGYGAYNGQQTNLYADTSAKYRCAAYQEDGYPAGRWRLPTPAELKVVGKMCAEGKLPSIFYDTYTYVSSNGIYTYSANGTFTENTNTNASRSVRCVYDIWYWKDVCKDKSQFIWGAEGDIANGAKSNYLVSVQ